LFWIKERRTLFFIETLLFGHVESRKLGLGFPLGEKGCLLQRRSFSVNKGRQDKKKRKKINISEDEDIENIYYVKDNGIGFDSQHLQDLFTPFKSTRYVWSGKWLVYSKACYHHGGND
jgi:hypothetical protein